MGATRTIVLTACLASPAAAPADDGTDRLRQIALCAGRYTATVEHLWLFDSAAAEAAAARRDGFVALLDALPADPALMAARVEARAAQRALWSAATFGGRPPAAAQARHLLALCDRLFTGV